MITASKLEEVSLSRSDLLKILASSKSFEHFDGFRYLTTLFTPGSLHEYINLKEIQRKANEQNKEKGLDK